jgi:predicted small lipoprotein YifL
MRKTLTALAASAGLMLSLAACGTSPEDQFVADVREAYPGITATETDGAILDLGQQSCAILDGGMTVEQLALGLVLSGLEDPEFAGTVIGAAIKNLCPEHMPSGSKA